MKRFFLALACTFFMLPAANAASHRMGSDSAAGVDRSAEMPRHGEAGRGNAEGSKRDLDDARSRSASGQQASPHRRGEANDDQVEGSDAGSTATESGARGSQAPGAQGGGVVHPKDP